MCLVMCMGSVMTCGWLVVGVTTQIDAHTLPPRIPDCRSGPKQMPCALTACSLGAPCTRCPRLTPNVAGAVALAAGVQAGIERADAMEVLPAPAERCKGRPAPPTDITKGRGQLCPS